MDIEFFIWINICIFFGCFVFILGYNIKKKVFVFVFVRSLKDFFVYVRVVGLMVLMVSVECFDREDLVGKVVLNMSFMLVDKEKWVYCGFRSF